MSGKTSTENADTIPSYQVQNPEELSRNILRFLEEGRKAFTTLMEKSGNQTGPYSAANEASHAAKTLTDVAQNWATDPLRVIDAQSKLMNNYAELWSRSFQRMMGQDVEPVAEPQPGDNRFKDPDWSENPFFDFWKQAYLLTAQWAEDIVENSDGIDQDTKRKAEFYLQQISSALSPSNFPLTNPEIVRETLATNAENLVQGMTNLQKDLDKSKDLLKISQTDVEAFEVGKNLATTPGKVVFQNDIIQLIQYAPSTEKVHEIPLLMVPPWINKFYILDLVPQKSFIKWAVAQGFTVFMVSWVNPDRKLADKTFEDYIKEGVIAATDAVTKTTGAKKVNTLGYCVGGTLLATALAYMAAKGDKRIQSATFLTTQVDFQKAGDLLVFIDDAQLKSLEEMMAERGYLDGSRMAAVFNFLRPKDLIWPYVVNNYFLGKKPFPFDLLFWNQDSTRMPAANHSFYLREFYHQNKLAEGDMVIDGEKLDLSKVKIPVYELATKEDHIAPVQSVFIGSKLFGGLVKFVVAGSGHIAGVVNPPEKQKYQYWTNRKKEETFDDWFATATSHTGSWWPDWAKWLAAKSGEKIEPRDPSQGKLKPIEDAPGAFVKEKT